jgi:Arc/MetJ-type ribon-helix-helix transcriptional regulator
VVEVSKRKEAEIHVRLTNDDLEFIDHVARRAGVTRSDAVRIAIQMFRIVLGLEAVDVDKVARAFREAEERFYEEHREELRREILGVDREADRPGEGG